MNCCKGRIKSADLRAKRQLLESRAEFREIMSDKFCIRAIRDIFAAYGLGISFYVFELHTMQT